MDFPFLLPLLRTPQANLEALVFTTPRTQGTPRGYAVFPLSDNHYKSLRVLSVHNTAIPWAPSTISRLRYLSLRFCAITGQPLPRDRFLEVLESCHDLEKLCLLSNFVSSATSSQSDISSRTVDLCHLRELALEDHPQITSWLLTCLKIPRCDRLELTGSAPASDQDTGSADGVFAHYFPRRTADRPALLSSPYLTYGEFTLDHFHGVDIVLRRSSHSPPTVILHFPSWNLDRLAPGEPGSAPPAPSPVDRALMDYMELFARCPLTTLIVTYEPPHTPSCAVFAQLLSAFPQLAIRFTHSLALFASPALTPHPLTTSVTTL